MSILKYTTILAVIMLSGLIIFSISCNKNDFADPLDGDRYIKLIDSVFLAIPEPSGLCMSPDEDSLYVASDRTNRIYKMTLAGKITDTLPYKGKNIQGITVNMNNKTLLVLETTDNKVVNITREGVTLDEFEIEDVPVSDTYEAIAFIAAQNKIIVFKRDLPGYILELFTTGEITGKYTTKFADSYGGACYETERKLLWVVSDSEKKMYTCTPRGSLVQQMNIDVADAEGIAVTYIEKNDKMEMRIFIISDSFQKLYIYKYKM